MTYQKVGFPTIDVTKPYGSYKVSTVDDHERETRRWMRQCMQALSGYPETDTVGVAGWTDSTRPRRSVNGNYLLGFNTSTQTLELIGENGNIQNLFRAFNLSAHPVGTVYETTDISFNPNSEWGGVWEKWEDGRFLLSTKEGEYAVNAIGGEASHVLTTSEIPTHDHRHYHNHYHTAGTLQVVGSFTDTSGAENTGFMGAHINAQTNNFNGEGCLSGHTSYDDTLNSTAEIGGGLGHNNMPPYRVVIRWHRIQ